MSNGSARGRFSTRALTAVAGLALLVALGGGAIAVGGGAQGEPPERLTEAEILSRLGTAPQEAPPFRATVAVEQTVIPDGLIGASQGDANGGPQTARIWSGGPDKARAELQGANGDKVAVRNGDKVWLYDGASNTLKVGEKPAGMEEPPEAKAASPEEIDRFLAEISPTSNLEAGDPVDVAGRWAYPLTLEPKDKTQTLVDGAEVLVDAETFITLRFELFAEDVPEPVVSYEAQDFEVGPVPEQRFQFETPPGATVEEMEPGTKESPEDKRGDFTEPQKVGSVEEASELAGFTVKGLPEAPGGRELEEIRVAADAAVLRYGSGWGTVVLTEKRDGGEAARLPQQAEDQDEVEDEGQEGMGEDVSIPTVGLGGGVQASEVSTPVGSVLTWTDGGVSYTLAGSVTAAEIEAAARGLVG